MDYKDYYAVLGIPRTASQKEIKKAFRKLAREHHPDTKGGDAAAEVRFKEVNEANAVLSDPDKRALYDRLGADWQSYARAGAGAPSGAGAGARAGGAGNPFGGYAGFGGAPGGNVRYEFHSTGDAGEFSDFFNAFFAGDSEPLSTPGRGRRATGGATFEDILAGMGLGADGGAAASRPGTTTTTAAPTATRIGRGHGRDHARRGLPRHEPARRGRGQAARGDDPARRRHRQPHPIDRQGTRRRRPVRRRPPASGPCLHASGRGPGTRAAADPRGGAARRRRQGPYAQGPRRAHDPGRAPSRAACSG